MTLPQLSERHCTWLCCILGILYTDPSSVLILDWLSIHSFTLDPQFNMNDKELPLLFDGTGYIWKALSISWNFHNSILFWFVIQKALINEFLILKVVLSSFEKLTENNRNILKTILVVICYFYLGQPGKDITVPKTKLKQEVGHWSHEDTKWEYF